MFFLVIEKFPSLIWIILKEILTEFMIWNLNEMLSIWEFYGISVHFIAYHDQTFQRLYLLHLP